MKPKNDDIAKQGRTASKEVRRQQLIDATIESIATRGFADTTIAKVSQGANLSYGIVNYHFTNKETLFADTLGFMVQEHYHQWSEARENAGLVPSKQLTAIIGVDFDPVLCSKTKLAVWFAFWGQAKQRPTYLKIHDKFDRQRDDTITQLCIQISEEGRYDHIDPKSIARKLVAMVDGFWLNLMLYPEICDRKQAQNDCLTFLSDTFPKHFTQ